MYSFPLKTPKSITGFKIFGFEMWIFDAGVYNCLFLPAAPVPHTATFDPYEALVGLSDPAPPAALVLGGESVGASRFSTTPTIEEPRRGLTCVSCRAFVWWCRRGICVMIYSSSSGSVSVIIIRAFLVHATQVYSVP